MSEDGVSMSTLICYSHYEDNKAGFEFCTNIQSSLDEECLEVLKNRLEEIADEMYDLRDKTDQISTDRLLYLGRLLSKDFWQVDYITRAAKTRPRFGIDSHFLIFESDMAERMKELGV